MVTQPFSNDERRGRLFEVLKGLDFDIAIFAEHGQDDEQGQRLPLFCPRLVIDRNGASLPWHQRWQPVLADMDRWARGDHPWLNDLSTTGERPGRDSGVPIVDMPGVKRLIDLGIESIMALPILEGNGMVASIVIGKKTGSYDEAARGELWHSEASQVARGLLADLERRREDLVREMRSRFDPNLPPEEIAKALATNLASELEWDFVGIYGIDRNFVLIGSCDLTEKKIFHLEPRLRLGLHRGMMATALTRGVCIRADDVTTDPPPFDYQRLDNFPAHSALCYPIKVGERFEWMLDCESAAVGAFHGPDLEVLNRLIERLRSTLELWFEMRLSRAILDGLKQCILVVDRDGNIQRANQSAIDAFGKSILGKPPADLALDESRKDLDPVRATTNARVRLRGVAGRPRPMLATIHMSSDAFGRWIVELCDPDEQQVLAGLQYAKTTVEEIAAQARGPLMLARALIGKAGKAVTDGSSSASIGDALSRAADNLGKADISYERLARALGGKEQSNLQALLNAVQAKLAPDLSMTFQVPTSGANTAIRASLNEATEALSSVLTKVANMTGQSPVRVTSSVHDDHVAIGLTGIGDASQEHMPAPAAVDPFRLVEDVARLSAQSPQSALQSTPASALDTVQATVRAEGWSLEQSGGGFEVRIPLARAAAMAPEGFGD